LGKRGGFFRFRDSFLPRWSLLFRFRHALSRLRRGFFSFWPAWGGAGFPVSGASLAPGAVGRNRGPLGAQDRAAGPAVAKLSVLRRGFLRRAPVERNAKQDTACHAVAA
jgi:hypothetical protein